MPECEALRTRPPRRALAYTSRRNVRGYRTGGFGALVIAAVGCFEPSYPVGLLCSPKGECPGDQVCVNDICVRTNLQPIDAGGTPDAPIPTFPDATPCVPTAGDDATCDGKDDDCDDRFDEDAEMQYVWYRDHDGDGHGLMSVWLSACAQPTGYTTSGDDCWDSLTEPERSRNAFPGQEDHQPGLLTESTTGVLGDWNCDGTIYYWESQCSEQCEAHPACIYYYEGWLTTFAECGETEQFCYSYDEYDHFCMESEVVVGVVVRQEDLGQLDEPDRGAEQLALGAFATVDQDPLAATAEQRARQAALCSGHGARGPEEDEIEVHRRILGARALKSDSAQADF